MALGELHKMKLIGYKDNTFASDKKSGFTYEALINPESYTLSYGTEVNSVTGQGSSEDIISFNKRSPQTLAFKFIFDGSGVLKKGGGSVLSGLAIPGLPNKAPNVAQDIADFKKVVYDYISDTHEPPYVQIQWGVLMYNCRLTRMTINFKLFKPDGTPVRAEADCTFQGVINEEQLTAIKNPLSPDLTHIKIVTEGDTLPLLCYREYGNSKYYYQVAKINGITDFKHLEPGRKLIFPPIAN